MKNAVLIAALPGTFASAAHAQSSVTLYGIVDAGISYVSNERISGNTGHSTWKETSGNINGSRWGFKGTEDLGGGLKAIFTLEGGFSTNNGSIAQHGTFFGRQAFVGLSSNQFGAVTLGRQYDPQVDYVGPLSLTGIGYGGLYFAHPFDNDNQNGSMRINNAVKYTSRTYNGFQFAGLYGFSNQAGGFANNRAYGVGASYNYGPLNVAAGYRQLNNAGGVLGNNAGATDNGSGGNDAEFTAQRQRSFGAGLNYAFGSAVVGFVFTQTKLDTPVSINLGGIALANAKSLRFNNYEVNAHYHLTSAFILATAYTYTDGRLSTNTGSSSPKWNQFSPLADYLLSKRKDVYLIGEYQRLSGGSLNGATIFTASIDGFTRSANNKQAAVTAGIRHRC
jgi:general bacterial porin, GBP family